MQSDAKNNIVKMKFQTKYPVYGFDNLVEYVFQFSVTSWRHLEVDRDVR